MRAFTLVELSVSLFVIMTLIGVTMINFTPVRDQTDRIQFESVIRQAKLELLSQKLSDTTQTEYTYTDEKGYRWVYIRRSGIVQCYTSDDVRIYSGQIYK